jgi:NAD(P)-dependent dehydrogenase (short-subunit alcohol dehydrogenase family)
MKQTSRPNRRTRAGRVLVTGALGYLGWRMLRGTGIDLEGQVVLITGGSRGLGLLMASEYAAAGCRIAICARDDVQLRNAAAELRAAGVAVFAVRCDVADRRQVESMVSRVIDHYGSLDILVNNAGIVQVGPIESMGIEDFERTMEVMFWGSLHTISAVLPGMVEAGGGRIVNITSIGGKVAVPHLLPYDTAKFALVGLSEGLRAELKRHGIRVTTIVPGLMRTGSPVNAFFKGNAEREFTWFSLGSATPLTTMSARRAARRIVDATRRGEAEVTLTWQANVLRVAQGLFPGLVADLMGEVDRMLPTGTSPAEHRGMHLATSLAPSPLTALMNRAARNNNEFGGRPRPSRRHAEKIGVSRER